MVPKCCPCSSQEMPGGFQVVLFWDKLHTFLAEYNCAKISPEEGFVGCPHCANSHFTNNNWHKIQLIFLASCQRMLYFGHNVIFLSLLPGFSSKSSRLFTRISNYIATFLNPFEGLGSEFSKFLSFQAIPSGCHGSLQIVTYIVCKASSNNSITIVMQLKLNFCKILAFRQFDTSLNPP